MLYSRTLLFTHPISNSSHLLIPNSHSFHPQSLLLPLGNHKSFSMSVSLFFFCSVQSLDRVWLSMTPWAAACQASLSFAFSWTLFKLMSIESVMPSDRLILCNPLLLLPSIFPSIRLFPMCWHFISPGTEMRNTHTHNRMLLSHEKEQNICSNMVGPRDSNTKWSKPDKDVYHII